MSRFVLILSLLLCFIESIFANNIVLDEKLPEIVVQKGVATIKVQVLNYSPDMKMSMVVFDLQDPTYENDPFFEFPLNDDGVVIAEIPICMHNVVKIGVGPIGAIDAKCIIAPGKITEFIIDLNSETGKQLTINGYYSETNRGLTKNNFRDWDIDTRTKDEFLQRLQLCKSGQERVNFLLTYKDEQIEKVNSRQDLTSTAKAIIRMWHESQCQTWLMSFSYLFSEIFGLNRQECDKLMSDVTSNPVEIIRTFELLNAPYAPISERFAFTTGIEGPNPSAFIQSLKSVYLAIRFHKSIEVERIKDPVCKQLIQEYYDEREQTLKSLAIQNNVSKNELDSVAPERILGTILGRYSGKIVLVDMWETWCGPCRQGHQLLDPFKKDMKDKPVVFVYLSSPSSPIETWQSMVEFISGDHYYLTEEQSLYIQSEIFKSSGIPTYGVFDSSGNKIYQQIGIDSMEKLQHEIINTMGK